MGGGGGDVGIALTPLIFTQVKQINETNKKGKKKIKGNSDITYYEAHILVFWFVFFFASIKTNTCGEIFNQGILMNKVFPCQSKDQISSSSQCIAHL